MASKGPKRESLSRYFKDLDECEGTSDASDDEINDDDKHFTKKTNNLISQKNNSSTVGKSSSNETTCSRNSDSPSTPSKTTTGSPPNLEKKGAGVKCDTASANKQNKLPSASECLNTKSNPIFLNLSEKKVVNWDSCQKHLDGNAGEEETLNFKSSAVPPPSSYEPITDPGIKVVDEEGRKRKIVGNDLEDQMTSSKAYKVHKENDDNEAEDDCS